MGSLTIAKLDRKLSRAVEQGKGVRLEAADLDLLGSIGFFDLTARAAADYLRTQSQCRDAQR